MCGIAGVFGHPERTAPLIERMLQAIEHRGPDDAGTFVGPDLAFGATRLAILDREGGHQPMWASDGRLGIVYNGEVYNARELAEGPLLQGVPSRTRCDTETVLRLYEAGGHAAISELLRSLHGMFALAIYDEPRNRLVLARDPFGIKPLYYRLSPDGSLVSFGSEIKALLADPACPRALNRDALVNYLSLQHNPLPETFFAGIYRLPAGSFAIVDLASGRMEIDCYWAYEFDDATPEAADALAARLRTAMEESVARHLISDVPVGAFLSGGIDSAVIATLAQEQLQAVGRGPLKTFTIGFEELDEFDAAREVADRIGTDHHEITMTADDFVGALPDIAWHFDEPVGDPSAFPLYLLAKAAREHVSVVLSGEGADELFGGYRVYLEPFAVDRVRRLPRPVRALAARLGRSGVTFPGINYLRRCSTALEDRYFGGGYGAFAPDEISRLLGSATIQPHVRPGRALALTTPGFTDLPESRRMQLIDVHTWLPDDILAKADRMSMASSLEVRVPFLDLDVANVSARVPDSLKYRDGTTKWILRRAFRGRLPASTERRRKLGFPTPLRQWLTRHPDALLAPIRQSTFLGEMIDLTYVEELAEQHAAGRIDASRRLLLLLMFAGWLDAFMGGDPIVPPSQRTQQAAADPVVEHLDLRSDYLRTEPSRTDERSEDPRPGVVNNFASRTAGATPRWIVQHYTYDDYDASLKLYLADGGTSAHYLVPAEAPFVQLLVAPEHRAHQAGSGALLPSSALNPYVGGGGLTEDMNSWSYGVENVNNAITPFPGDQIRRIIQVMDSLVRDTEGFDPRYVIAHSDWAPGRKLDPGPYFPWQTLAKASELYPDVTSHNFGVYSFIPRAAAPRVVVSALQDSDPAEIIRVQEGLRGLGYAIPVTGVLDEITLDGIFSFKVHFQNQVVIAQHEQCWFDIVRDVDARRNREVIAQWTTDDQLVLEDVIRQYM